MKIKIEVNVPDSVDLEHAIESISDATFVADNVTQAEANLVFSMLTKLQVEKDRVVDTNKRDFNQPYQTTSVSQIATQIKNLVEKIRQTILDYSCDWDLVLDWDSNEIKFDKGYIVPRVAPLVITDTHKFLFQSWEDSSELLKQLYWKASSFDYVLVVRRKGELIIKLCQNIEDEAWARSVAFANYQKSIYDCKKSKEVKL
jgi:hypothetical protein